MHSTQSIVSHLGSSQVPSILYILEPNSRLRRFPKCEYTWGELHTLSRGPPPWFWFILTINKHNNGIQILSSYNHTRNSSTDVNRSYRDQKTRPLRFACSISRLNSSDLHPKMTWKGRSREVRTCEEAWGVALLDREMTKATRGETFM